VFARSVANTTFGSFYLPPYPPDYNPIESHSGESPGVRAIASPSPLQELVCGKRKTLTILGYAFSTLAKTISGCAERAGTDVAGGLDIAHRVCIEIIADTAAKEPCPSRQVHVPRKDIRIRDFCFSGHTAFTLTLAMFACPRESPRPVLATRAR